ncbi:MAG: hypothetical protein JXB42_08620 [Deltaproteobacteria bacterium]|nr:hypothetical protein [Deltaproteobacteria bacterium]
MKAICLLIGIGLLTLGRRLFWLFVGSVGFIAGFTYAQEFLAIQSTLVTVLIAIRAGVVGALVSIFLQGFAIGVAGFLAGTYILYVILSFFGLQTNVLWLVYIIGGAAGTVCMFMLFDWALIVISSLTGAAFIVDTIQLNVPLEVIIFIVLGIAGIVFQARLTGKR